MKWTTEESDILKSHIKDGLTYQEISNVMNKSHASIRNRANRMKIKPRPKIAYITAFKDLRGESKPVSRYKPRPYVGGKLLADLKIMECHFPHEGQVYCGERAIKPYGYCQTHQDICYTKNTCRK